MGHDLEKKGVVRLEMYRFIIESYHDGIKGN